MSDRDEATVPDPPATGGGMPEVEAGLSELRSRLGELQRSVETLGSHGHWPGAEVSRPPPPAPPAAQPSPPPQPSPYPPAPTPPQPPAYPPAPAPPAQGIAAASPPPLPSQSQFALPPVRPPVAAPLQPPPGAEGYGQPPPAEWEQPLEPPPPMPPVAPAPPVATNGHGAEAAGISAPSATVAAVDAGPFADLIELRHFEEDLGGLAAVRDVRVRRFGHGRARIDVGMAGPYYLARELQRLERPLEVSAGEDDEVRVELAASPQPEADEPGPAEAGAQQI